MNITVSEIGELIAVLDDGAAAVKKIAEREQLKYDLERARLQLAGCGVVANANTRATLEGTMQSIHPDFQCAALTDVADAVRREIGLREERDRLTAENAALTARWERLNTKLRAERLASLDRPVEGYTDGLDSALYMMAALEREEQHGESR